MKVVFLEDVPNVAEAGEMKEVADGYGRNFLIPRKLAVLADAKAAYIVEAQLKKKARIQAQTEAEMIELARQLEGSEITLKVRSGAKGRLYGSITNTDIAAELDKSTGLVIDKRKMELDEPIREVGSYEIAIRLTKDIIPKIKLTVMGEEKEEGKEKKEEKVGKEKKAKPEEKKGKVEKEKKAKPEEKKEKVGKEKKVKPAEEKGKVGKEKKAKPTEKKGKVGKEKKAKPAEKKGKVGKEKKAKPAKKEETS